RVVRRAHRLAAQIFIDRRHIAEILPILHQVGPIAMVPWKMISGEINEDKHRPVGALFGEHACGGVEKETIRFQIPGAEVMLSVETLQTGLGLEISRAHKSTERRIKRKGAIAAALQRRRQTAVDAAGGNSRHKIGKAAE